MSLGDCEKSKQLHERAMKTKESHYGPDHPQTGITLTNLGNLYGKLCEHQKGKQFLERALPMCSPTPDILST